MSEIEVTFTPTWQEARAAMRVAQVAQVARTGREYAAGGRTVRRTSSISDSREERVRSASSSISTSDATGASCSRSLSFAAPASPFTAPESVVWLG